MMKKKARDGLQYLSASVAVIFALLLGPGAHGEELDRFRISAGGYSVFRSDSTISLTQTSAGVGVSFSPDDTLGWNGEQTVFRLDGAYRINDHHSMSLSWYRISTTGSRFLQDEVSWVDVDGNVITIDAGVGVRSKLVYETYKLGYLWSFYRTDKVELAVGAGLHLTDVKVDLSAETTSTGLAASAASTAVPMPVLTFALNYDITEKLNWYLRTELFAVSFGDWSGTYSDIQLGLEYRPFRHVGFGAGLSGDSLRVTEESDNKRFEFDHRISALHLFVSTYF